MCVQHASDGIFHTDFRDGSRSTSVEEGERAPSGLVEETKDMFVVCLYVLVVYCSLFIMCLCLTKDMEFGVEGMAEQRAWEDAPLRGGLIMAFDARNHGGS